MTRAAGQFTEVDGIGILSPDSRGYLTGSESLEAVQAWPWMRRGYPLILFLLRQLGDPVTLAVLLHVLTLLIVSTLLYREVEQRASMLPALVAVAVLVLNPMTALWVRLVLTESLFFAGIMLLLILGHQAIEDRLSRLGHITAAGVAGLLPFLRANGIFVSASLITTLLIAKLSGRTRVLAVASVWVVLLAFLPTFSATIGPPSEGSLTRQLYDGVIIEGTENVRLAIAMPDPADESDESLSAAARYALDNPLAVARVGVARVGFESLQVRPHYPTVVNLAFGAAMLLYLTAALVGLRDSRSRGWRLLAGTFSIPLLILTAGTFAVPEGRYGWAFLLPLAPIAGIGSDRIGRSVLGIRDESSSGLGKRSTSSS
jgi:hypothetical protein